MSVQSTEQKSDVKQPIRSEQTKRRPCARQIQAQETLSEDECKSLASSCTETSTSTGNILDRLILDPSRNREPFLKQWPVVFPKSEETVPNNPHQYRASMKAEQLNQMCSLHVDSDPNKFRVPAIIATLGPTSTTVNSVLELLESGVNVVRVSMAHADPCSRISYFQNIIEATNRYSTQIDYTIPIGIMMDLKGPEIRTGKIDTSYLKDLSSVELPLKKGSIVRLTCDRLFENRCSEKFIFVDFESLPVHVEPGICIYLDGDVKLRVESVVGLQILCKIESEGILRNYQQVHIPMVALPIPPITEYDRKCLNEAVEQGVDIVVVPKTRSEKIIYSVKAVLEEKESDILVFAKISNYEGLCNIDRIISAADGIVIHKCDLALELPAAKMFIAQKEIIAKCNKAGKPVVCPAQLKSSMSDVAQFIIDGGDCVMLTVETAVEEEGPRSVLRLCEVIREAEAATMQIPYYNDLVNLLTPAVEPNCAIALAAVEVSNKIRAAAVLTITTSGLTAKLLSWFRPRCPVIAITRIGRTARQLNMWRTVIPLVYSGPPMNDWHEDCAARIRYGISYGKYKEIIRPGDPLVLVTGYRKNAGFTNCLRVVFVSLDNGHIIWVEPPIIYPGKRIKNVIDLPSYTVFCEYSYYPVTPKGLGYIDNTLELKNQEGTNWTKLVLDKKLWRTKKED